MKRGDKLVLVILIGVFLLSGLYVTWQKRAQAGGLTAVITSGGKLVREIDLTEVAEPFQLRVDAPNGGYNLLLVEKNRIRVIAADCPEQVDVRQGWISAPHQSLVCLPNRLAITLRAAGRPDVDGVVR